jgi:hypothetical protein
MLYLGIDGAGKVRAAAPHVAQRSSAAPSLSSFWSVRPPVSVSLTVRRMHGVSHSLSLTLSLYGRRQHGGAKRKYRAPGDTDMDTDTDTDTEEPCTKQARSRGYCKDVSRRCRRSDHAHDVLPA